MRQGKERKGKGRKGREEKEGEDVRLVVGFGGLTYS